MINTGLAERIVAHLKKDGGDVRRSVLEQIVLKHGFSKEDFYTALKEIGFTVANVAEWKKKDNHHYLRYYKPDAFTNKVQESLDRGQDW
jgi:hypothetical protein